MYSRFINWSTLRGKSSISELQQWRDKNHTKETTLIQNIHTHLKACQKRRKWCSDPRFSASISRGVCWHEEKIYPILFITKTLHREDKKNRESYLQISHINSPFEKSLSWKTHFIYRKKETTIDTRCWNYFIFIVYLFRFLFLSAHNRLFDWFFFCLIKKVLCGKNITICLFGLFVCLFVIFNDCYVRKNWGKKKKQK